MANITTTVPNLIQGVSQQSPQVRLAGQCEEQINGLSTVTKGLTKRPPARLTANLGAIASEGDFLHFVNRSESERYVVTMENRSRADGKGVIRVFNLDTGAEGTITGADVIAGDEGGYTFNNNYSTVANASNTHDQIKALTIGDSTFLLNTAVTVVKTAELSEELDASRALVFIKQGDYSKKYGLKFREKGTFNGGGAKFDVTWSVEAVTLLRGVAFSYTYKIESVSVNSGGSDYDPSDEPTLEFPSVVEWSIRPEFDITVDSSGAVTGITLLHPGETIGYPTAQTFATTIGSSEPFDEVHIVTAKSGANSSEGAADTTNISQELTKALKSVSPAIHLAATSSLNSNVTSNYTSKDKDGTILINRNDNNDFFLEAFDGLAGSGLGLVHKEVDSLSDLPVRGPDGFRVAVRGDANANEDDYYLRFETNDGQSFGEGGWQEDVGPAINVALDPDTLPLQLINTGLNTFTISTTGWSKRKVGDEETNPFPSFVGKTLNNFVFFKNRLGFIYEDSVVLSEAGELFNFFRTTVRTLLDTAPIDVTSATANVTNLRGSVAFQENLLLFSDRGQFVLKGDPLTNQTITLEAVTNYEVNTSENPLVVGSYVYFPFTRGNFLGMQEYSLNATTDVYDSADITTQVPGYLNKGNILVTSGSSATDLIALSSGGNTIYVYKYFFNGREKIVSSWSKFQMPFNVLSLEFINSSLFVIGDKEGETLITELKCEELRREDDTVGGVTIHLDMLKKHTIVGSATELPTDLIVDLGFTPDPEDVIEAYDHLGKRVLINYINGSLVSVKSYNRTFFTGVRYNLEYTFSEPVFKQGNPPIASGLSRMILRNGTLFFTDALDFQVEVTPLARDKRIFTYSPNVINVTSTDTILSQDGNLRFSIFTQAKDSVIKIINSSAFASNFQACEFEVNVHTRSNRIQ